MGIIFQTFPGSLNSQSKAASQCSQKAFRKDSSPLLMGKWQERIPGSLPCHPIHVVSYEKVSYPMFPPTFTSCSMTDDSGRKIRTLGNWAASSSSGIFEKIRQIYSFLELWQPYTQVHGLMNRRTEYRLLISVPSDPWAAHSVLSRGPPGSSSAKQHLSPPHTSF